MANINFGILDTQSPAKIGNAFIRSPEQQNANMLQVMQMQQLMDQREQAQYALGKSRREDAGLAAFGEGLRALGPDPDPDAVAQLFIKHPDIGMQKTGIELMQRSQANKKYLSLKQPGGAGASPVAAAPSAAPAPGSFGENMLANRAALAFGDNPPAATVAAPAAPVTPRTRESRIAQLRTEAAKLAPLALPGTFAKAERDDILEEIKGLLKPQVMAAGSVFDAPGVDRVTAPEAPSQDIRTMTALGYPNTQEGYAAFRDAQRPDKIPAPPSMVAEYTFAKTPDGGGFRGSFQDFVKERAAAARPPAQPRPEQPPVAVVDPLTGKTIYVSREEALSGRMTPANAMEGLPPKEIQKREASFPKATSALKGFEVSADTLAKDLETLAAHPGLSSITGIAAGRLPGITSEGRAAQALYNKIVARGGFQELQNLRMASPTGGALGNVSNQEGTQLKNAFAAIDRTQDAKDVSAALLRAAEEAKASKVRVREAYDSTYEYRTPSEPKAAAATPGKWGKAVAE